MKRLTLAAVLGLVVACNSDSKKTDQPTIAVFTAAPSTIIAGQSTQLVFGGTGTLSIDQGVGPVTGKTSVTVSPTATTTYTLTASLNGSSVTSTTQVTVNPLPTAGLVVVRSGTADPVAGTPADFEIRAVTPAGTLNPGYRGTVKLTTDDPQATLPADYTFTASDAGKKVLQVTLRRAGVHPVTATDTASSSVTGTTVVLVGPGAAAGCAIGNLPATAAAGAQVGLRVTALDAFGNVATGYTGQIALTSSDAAAQLGAPGTFDPSDLGVRAFSVQLRTAGNQTVTATDASTPALTCQAPVSVVPGSTLLTVTFPLLGQGLDAWAGAATTARIRAQDAQGNAVTDYAGTVAFTSSDGAAVLPANVTFAPADGGQKDVTVTFSSIGPQTLTATDTGAALVSGASKAVTVHGLVYTDPTSGAGKVRLVRNAASNAKLVKLDLVSSVGLNLSSSGASARNGAFGAGMNLPLDASKVAADATLLDLTAPGTSTAILNLGTGTQAKAAVLNATTGVLYSGISQKRVEAGSATVRGDAAIRPYPAASSFYYSLRLVLVPGATVGTVFDGSALGTTFRAAVRDRSGSDVFGGSDFAIGKLEVK